MTRAENYVTVEFLSRSSNEGFARTAAAAFAAQLDPTLDELAEETGLTVEEIASIELAVVPPESLQQETVEGMTLESVLGTEEPETGMVERIALREAIDQLPEQERKAILLRFFKGLTQEQTARLLHVSQVQVSRMERRSLKRLRELLDD